jgi:hypothetical protein
LAISSGGETENLPIAGNNFSVALAALGFDTMITGAQLRVDQDGFVDFYYVGAESGFTNAFSTGVQSLIEHNEGFNFAGYSSLTIAVSAGDVLNFRFTIGGVGALSPVDNFNATNLEGLGIFFDSDQSGSLQQILLGYDNQIIRDDDNHDDMLVRADFRPVPIPASAWLFGSALVGLAAVARRKAA